MLRRPKKEKLICTPVYHHRYIGRTCTCTTVVCGKLLANVSKFQGFDYCFTLPTQSQKVFSAW